MGAEVDTPTEVAAAPETTSDARSPSQIRGVYTRAVRAWLPELVSVMDRAPWYCEVSRRGRSRLGRVATLRRQLLASLAVALAIDDIADEPTRAYLRTCVGASLVRWQLTLRGDGRPGRMEVRRSDRLPLITSALTRLLSECADFTSTNVIEDLDRHLRWLGTRRPFSPRCEAELISALVDGALLIRDAGLLRMARERLGCLLSRQSREGWFFERFGADFGRLSHTVDALARVHAQYNWPELVEPLGRALHFLTHMVHPDMSVGPSIGHGEATTLYPYGLELLAEEFPDGALLASAARQRLSQAMERSGMVMGISHDLSYAASAALVPTVSTGVGRSSAWPHAQNGSFHFKEAGVQIVSTDALYAVIAGRQGGALRVTWRNGEVPLDDAGVSVVWSRRLKVSGLHASNVVVRAGERQLESEGALRPVESPNLPGLMDLRHWLSRVWCVLGFGVCDRLDRPGCSMGRCRAGDRYRRSVSIHADKVRIHDVVNCQLPCAQIVCQSPGVGDGGLLSVDEPVPVCQRTPIFLEGARRRAIDRTYVAGRLVTCRVSRGDHPGS